MDCESLHGSAEWRRAGLFFDFITLVQVQGMSILGIIWLPIDADLDCFSCHHAITSVVLLLLMIAMNTTLLASDSAYDVHARRFCEMHGFGIWSLYMDRQVPPPPPPPQKKKKNPGF